MPSKYLEDTVEYPLEFKEKPLPWQELGFSLTASGYGARLPSRYMVKYRGTWRRIYHRCYANTSSAYIMSKGQRYFLRSGPDA